jgi:hypothetical protein
MTPEEWLLQRETRIELEAIAVEITERYISGNHELPPPEEMAEMAREEFRRRRASSGN